MATDKKKKSRRKHPAKPEFHALELVALAALCSHWAERIRNPSVSDPVRTTEKVRRFRDAVLVGQGGREAWEREFVQDEFEVMRRAAVHFLVTRPDRPPQTVPVELGERGAGPQIERPFPIAKSQRERFWEYVGDGRSTEESLAARLAELRLGVKIRRVRGYVRADKRKGQKRRVTTTHLQQLAASVFFDLSLCPPPDADELGQTLLAALDKSGYDPIMLYYVVQKAQMLEPLPEGEQFELISKKDFERLCGALKEPGRSRREKAGRKSWRRTPNS